MGSKYLYRGCVIFLMAALAIGTPVFAGNPTEKIKQTTDEILGILSDPALKEEGKAKERKRLVRQAVDRRFDWEEMGRRALARHWIRRTDEQKREFIALFGKLIERTYLAKMEGYSGEEVNYGKEIIEGDYGVVNVKISTAKGLEIPLRYRLRKKGDDWLVYDIIIEGVSLVKNYRVQFNHIISRYSYKTLIKKLKKKVAEK